MRLIKALQNKTQNWIDKTVDNINDDKARRVEKIKQYDIKIAQREAKMKSQWQQINTDLKEGTKKNWETLKSDLKESRNK